MRHYCAHCHDASDFIDTKSTRCTKCATEGEVAAGNWVSVQTVDGALADRRAVEGKKLGLPAR
jgi:DnaJ-class molecular chaperone